MTKGKPVKALLKFSVPLFAGNIMQNLYNVFDTAVVGYVLGKNTLAAVGNSYVPMLIINSIILGLSSGILILLAQMYGSGEKAQGCMGSIRTLVFLIGGGLACIFFLSAGWIFRAMGIPAAAARPAAEYLRITALGIPFLSAYNFYSAVAKAGGDARTPVRDMSVSCLMNIVLDYVFVVILRLGIRGAAFSLTFPFCVSLYLLTNFLRGAGEIAYPVFNTMLELGFRTAFAFVSVRYIGFYGIMLCRPLSFLISTASLSCRYFTKKWQGR